MRIGIPREVKRGETRVALTPAAVRELVAAGHQVTVEYGAGLQAGFGDDTYVAAGAGMTDSASSLWGSSDLLVKVKEPQPEEFDFFRPDLMLFGYLHLASDSALTQALCASGVTAVAFETVVGADGSLPILNPMSRIAGTLAGQVAAVSLYHASGGSGLLIGGMPGVAPAKVAVIGGGTVGTHAALTMARLGAEVVVLDVDQGRLDWLDANLPNRSRTLVSNHENLAEQLAGADVVVGAVLIPGARAPHLISRNALKTMKPRSVIVDVAIDQGGCAETSRVTTHDDPTFLVDDVVHYCVGNMPAAVPRTASNSLSNAALPYVKSLASRSLGDLVEMGDGLAQGINAVGGAVVSEPVARSLAIPHESLEKMVGRSR